ncbi:hypothetical protein [Sphingomonas palmae]|uniref:hypothetical protein n=1 Tax=Sphingomonas palmae TaxID=1855283 RepID=UPI00115FC5E2|nr:hypothetical protein [Sphingomonas palmae]
MRVVEHEACGSHASARGNRVNRDVLDDEISRLVALVADPQTIVPIVGRARARRTEQAQVRDTEVAPDAAQHLSRIRQRAQRASLPIERDTLKRQGAIVAVVSIGITQEIEPLLVCCAKGLIKPCPLITVAEPVDPQAG